EEPMTRGDSDVVALLGNTAYVHYLWAQLYCASGHLIWIGDRTRGVEDWHVQWASSIANPVGVKIGPSATLDSVVSLVRLLNQRREQGRLSLIARLGAHEVTNRLGSLVGAVAELRSSVLWQCDPMHANTRKLGRTKMRLLPDIRREITGFVRTLR